MTRWWGKPRRRPAKRPSGHPCLGEGRGIPEDLVLLQHPTTTLLLLVTSAGLVVTGALLVVTMFAIRDKCLTTSNKRNLIRIAITCGSHSRKDRRTPVRRAHHRHGCKLVSGMLMGGCLSHTQLKNHHGSSICKEWRRGASMNYLLDSHSRHATPHGGDVLPWFYMEDRCWRPFRLHQLRWPLINTQAPTPSSFRVGLRTPI